MRRHVSPRVAKTPSTCFPPRSPAADAAAAAVVGCARPRSSTQSTPCRHARRGCPGLHFHRRTFVAAPPLKCRRLHGIVSGILRLRKHGLHLRRRRFHVHRRSALAAVVSSFTAPIAGLGGAAVAVVARSAAPPTGHRILRLPGSDGCVAFAVFVSFSRPAPPAPSSAFTTATAPSIADGARGV